MRKPNRDNFFFFLNICWFIQYGWIIKSVFRFTFEIVEIAVRGGLRPGERKKNHKSLPGWNRVRTMNWDLTLISIRRGIKIFLLLKSQEHWNRSPRGFAFRITEGLERKEKGREKFKTGMFLTSAIRILFLCMCVCVIMIIFNAGRVLRVQMLFCEKDFPPDPCVK